MTFTRFMDMHSGGPQKEKYAHIYIEAPEEEAKVIFQNHFGHNPDRVSCTCCGPDYSITEYKTLREATAYDRGCASAYRKGSEGYYLEKGEKPKRGFSVTQSFYPYMTLKKYLSQKQVLVLRKKDITPEERKGVLREEGFVWR